MGKQYSFSKGSVAYVDDRGVSITGLMDYSAEFGRLKSVYYAKPGLIFSGYMHIGDTYVTVRKEDVTLAEEFLADLESLGVFVQFTRKKCTENYIEHRCGALLPTLRIRDGKFYVVHFANKACQVDVSKIKSIWVYDGYITFNRIEHDNTDNCIIKVMYDNGDEGFLSSFFKNKYKDEVIKFANKVSALGENIQVNVLQHKKQYDT